MLDDVANLYPNPMSEIQYIRELFNLSLWILGGLTAFLGVVLVGLAKWGAEKIDKRLDQQDRKMKERLDRQDGELISIKQLLFEDGRAVRELFHEHDKRIDRVEYGRRRDDLPMRRNGDEP